MSHTIDFFFDFLSPYAYYARHELVRIAAKHGATIAYKPADLQRLKKAAGNTGPATVQMPRKLAYAIADFKRWGERYGITPAHSPACFDVRDLNVGILHAAALGKAEAYAAAGFERVWGQGGAKQDPQQLFQAVADKAGIDAAELRAFAKSPGAEQAYEAIFEEACSKGVFGVPTFVIGDELWWGNDRLFMVEERLASSATSARLAPAAA